MDEELLELKDKKTLVQLVTFQKSKIKTNSIIKAKLICCINYNDIKMHPMLVSKYF